MKGAPGLPAVASVTWRTPPAPDRLPEGVTLRSSGTSQGTCQETLHAVTCDLGSLAAGASATVTVTVMAPTAGTIVDTATVASDAVDDPDPAYNSATVSTAVANSADLGLTMTAGPDPVGKNKTLTYTAVVRNPCPSAATGVVVRDTLPATVTFLSRSPQRSLWRPSRPCPSGPCARERSWGDPGQAGRSGPFT